MAKFRLKNTVRKLERDIELSLNSVGKVAESTLKEKIRTEVYGRPESDSYDRSFGFLNSTRYDVEKTGVGFSVFSHVDPNLMGYTAFEEHSSWVDGSDQRENLTMWLNYGHGGLASYKGAFFIEKSIEELRTNKEHLKTLANSLKAKGYKVYIR